MIKIEVEKVGEELDISAEQQGNSLDNLIELAAGVHRIIYDMAENAEEFIAIMFAFNRMLNGVDYEGLKGVFTSELQQKHSRISR